MATADQRFKYFPFVTGDTGQPPPGCETLTLPIPRQWWQTNAMKVRWGDLSPGELISAVVSGLNGIWTCALVQGLYIQLERVYADGIEEWEELHPNTVPEDELLLGFYLHMTGPFSDLVAFSAELKSLIEKAGTCRTQLNSRRDPIPIAGSLVRITERTVILSCVWAPLRRAHACAQVWRAVQYCQQGGHVVHPTIEALFVEGSFREQVALHSPVPHCPSHACAGGCTRTRRTSTTSCTFCTVHSRASSSGTPSTRSTRQWNGRSCRTARARRTRP